MLTVVSNQFTVTTTKKRQVQTQTTLRKRQTKKTQTIPLKPQRKKTQDKAQNCERKNFVLSEHLKLNFKPQTIQKVIETNYIMPGHHEEATKKIQELIKHSDKIIFFVFSLNMSQIVKTLVDTINEKQNLEIKIFINNNSLKNFIELLMIFANEFIYEKKEEEKQNFVEKFNINTFKYSKDLSQIHSKKIIFYKDNEIIIIEGGANFSTNGFCRSIDSTSLKQYTKEATGHIENEISETERCVSESGQIKKISLAEIKDLLKAKNFTN